MSKWQLWGNVVLFQKAFLVVSCLSLTMLCKQAEWCTFCSHWQINGNRNWWFPFTRNKSPPEMANSFEAASSSLSLLQISAPSLLATMWKTATAGPSKILDHLKISASSWLHFILQIDCPTRRPLEGQLPGGSGWKQLRRLPDGHRAAHQAPVCHTGASDGQHTRCDGQHTRRCAKSEKEEKEERIGNCTGGTSWFPAAAPRPTERDV